MAGRASANVQVEGIKELRKTLTEFAPKQVDNLLRQAVFALARDARDKMKRRVKKRSSRLAKSIYAVRRRGKPGLHVSEVRGGATAPYGFILEFGSRSTKAQPFITPTVEQLRAKLAEHYRENFGKQLEKAMAKRARASGKMK